jgi:hypothetical protein
MFRRSLIRVVNFHASACSFGVRINNVCGARNVCVLGILTSCIRLQFEARRLHVPHDVVRSCVVWMREDHVHLLVYGMI